MKLSELSIGDKYAVIIDDYEGKPKTLYTGEVVGSRSDYPDYIGVIVDGEFGLDEADLEVEKIEE